ncbi:hypothetical protein BST43_06795 [Mycobacteroides saopaulense]|uniref:DUF4145 domain-containing protein n=1 Tax=Mycobacteroides saopaulense TaxID=1578165 RepID=A0A1X0J9T0_9MYCO|nr:hypothetical protein [Mycobacteroides saopaulense]ORB59689.1 hypothetical protein BST43_06795 [Mycobacteroides saopaulense]
MSVLEFIAEMSDAWAWPLVVAAGIVLLKSEIKSAVTSLVGRVGEIQRLKAPGLSIEFERGVRELAATTEELQPEVTTLGKSLEVALPQESPQERLSNYQELSAVSPRAAIISSFSDLERLIRQRFTQLYPRRSESSFARLVDVLQHDEHIRPNVASALRTLIEMRNKVVHSGVDPDQTDAGYFLDALGNLTGYLLLSGFFGEPKAEG